MIQLRDNYTRAKLAQIFVIIVILVEIVSIFSMYLQYNILTDFSNGIFVSDDQLAVIDDRGTLIGNVYLLSIIVSAIFFIRWFRRAYFNLHLFTNTLQFSEGWAAGAWFVPIVNLGRPLRIMQELFVVSKQVLIQHEVKFDNKKEFVGVWWTFFIVSNILGNFASRLSFRADSVEELLDLTFLHIASSITLIISGVLLIKIIKNYMFLEIKLAEIKTILQ